MARSEDGKPVTIGLIALAGVGLVVGLLVSGAALAATQVLGLGSDGSSATTGTAGSQQTMYLPTPVPTSADPAPAITLAPVPAPGEAAGDGGVVSSAPPVEVPETATTAITLSTSVTQVGTGQEVPLDGTYVGGDGATLQVERFSNGAWGDFPVDASVNGETFSTYIRTSQTGETRFRMRDVASGLTSNEVTVTIG